MIRLSMLHTTGISLEIHRFEVRIWNLCMDSPIPGAADSAKSLVSPRVEPSFRRCFTSPLQDPYTEEVE